MKENLLLKIALIGSITGLILLFFMSEQIKVDETTLDKLDQLELDTTIKVKGIISRITEFDKMAIIELTEPQTRNVIIFKEGNITEFKQGDFVEVEGNVQEYEDEFQLIGNQIKIIN